MSTRDSHEPSVLAVFIRVPHLLKKFSLLVNSLATKNTTTLDVDLKLQFSMRSRSEEL